jgi:hypothetical protein
MAPSKRKESKARSKTGTKTPKGKRFSLTWAKADDPIYKRGFAIGVVRSIPSSKSTPAITSPSSSEPQTPSSSPPQPNEGEDSTPTV